MAGEIKEGGKILDLSVGVARIRELRAWVTELIEEGMNHGVHSRKSLRWGILEEAGDEVDRICIGLSEDLVEGVRLDLGKFMFHIVRVHGADLIPGWCAQDLDDLHELIDARFSGE